MKYSEFKSFWGNRHSGVFHLYEKDMGIGGGKITREKLIL